MPPHTDHTIATLAAQQLGLVTRAQLLQHGVTGDTIDFRIKTRRLRAIHRGVYLVGPLIAPHMTEMAAVLACGPHAVLSHRSAAPPWQLRPAAEMPVDVSVKTGDRSRPGIRVHRMSFEADDVTVFENIPITTATRTLFDLATILDRRELEQTLALGERLNVIDREKLRSLMARHPTRRGTPLLRALLDGEGGPACTQSEAEERFLALIRKVELPPPEVNVMFEKVELDFFWRREGVVVEVDGFGFHSSRRDFERDRVRDARLTASGLRVVRVTWRQIVDEPQAMLVRLTRILVGA